MEFFNVVNSWGIPLLSAFVMGVVVVACPCTFASNVTILTSMVNKNVTTINLFTKSFFYIVGRIVAYVSVAVLLESFSENISFTESLQYFLGKIMGPIFLLVGILMLDIIHIHGFENKCLVWLNRWSYSNNNLLSFFLGLCLAFAFCPYGALIYFGMMIPLSITSDFGLWIPILFSFGTALPIIFVAVFLFCGWNSKKQILEKFQKFELWLRRILAIFFVVSGILFILEFYFE